MNFEEEHPIRARSNLSAPLDPLPTGHQKAVAIRAMFDQIAPRYDLVNRVMTFRLDVGWRRRAVDSLRLEPGSWIIDVACGTGDLCRELEGASLNPIGIDFSSGMLKAARTQAPLVQADALRLPLRDRSVDGATCGFALRNVENLEHLFAEIARVIRPEGQIALLEVAEPVRPIPRLVHRVHFRHVVPIIGGLLSNRDAYSYLPRSTAYLPRNEEMLAMLEAVGFISVKRQLLSLGAAQLITGTRSELQSR